VFVGVVLSAFLPDDHAGLSGAALAVRQQPRLLGATARALVVTLSWPRDGCAPRLWRCRGVCGRLARWLAPGFTPPWRSLP
jgi:hypothetical protein